MTAEFKKEWTEADVNALIGQSESIRLEFKAGIMFDRESEERWKETLSKAVSALANTEGGELVLGIVEGKAGTAGKGKARLAETIDGAPKTIDRERLHRIIEGNVSPALVGLKVRAVKLLEIPDRVVFVIHVPQGSTAYQANDGRYYGRSEFEAKHLPDHEIRLRMSRGKVARASVHLRLGRVALGAAHEAEVRKRNSAAIEAYQVAETAMDPAQYVLGLLDVIGASYHPDEISFGLFLRNDGELTIRDPGIEVSEVYSKSFDNGWTVECRPQRKLVMRDEVIYPGDENFIPGSKCELRCKRNSVIAPADYAFQWKVYLDNSPPNNGEIDVGEEIQKARIEGTRLLSEGAGSLQAKQPIPCILPD